MPKYVVHDYDSGKKVEIEAHSEDDALRKYVMRHMGSAADELDIQSAMETFGGEVYEKEEEDQPLDLGVDLSSFDGGSL